MSRETRSVRRLAGPLAAALVASAILSPPSIARAQGAQANDEAYTAKIKEYLQDARISTELVDHLPASSTVPTPLKFLGKIVGTPGELTYAKGTTAHNLYVQMMTKHHRGAIAAAHEEINHGQSPELVEFARMILRTREAQLPVLVDAAARVTPARPTPTNT